MKKILVSVEALSACVRECFDDLVAGTKIVITRSLSGGDAVSPTWVGNELAGDVATRLSALCPKFTADARLVELSEKDVELIDEGLGALSSDYNDVDHDAIGALRARLAPKAEGTPSPGRLWRAAGGNRDRYIELMKRHGWIREILEETDDAT